MGNVFIILILNCTQMFVYSLRYHHSEIRLYKIELPLELRFEIVLSQSNGAIISCSITTREPRCAHDKLYSPMSD